MKKWLIFTAAAVVLILMIVASAWLWLTHSASGMKFALARTAGVVDRLEYDSLSGGLAKGITLTSVRFAQSGTRVEADRLELAARVELLSGPRVVVRRLHASGIDVYLPQEEAETKPDGEPFRLSQIASPVEVVAEDIDISDLRIHSGDEPLAIDHIRLAGSYGHQAVVDRLEAESRQLGIRADARGQWALQDSGRGQLQLNAALDLDDGQSQNAALDLSGRLDDLQFALEASGPADIKGTGQIAQLPDTPSISASLTGRVADWPDLPLALDDLELAVEGQPEQWQATTSGRAAGPDIPPARWNIDLAGGLESLRIEDLDIEVLAGQIHGQGGLDWSSSAPAASARLDFDGIDLTPLYPDWPNQGRLGGRVEASSRDGAIYIEQLAVQARPGKLDIKGSGQIDPEADTLDFNLDWQHFAWPPVSDDSEPLVSSESGQLSIEGGLSSWRMHLQALLAAPQAPGARVEARVSGSQEQADIARLVMTADDGSRAEIAGRVGWQPDINAELTLQLEQFDPGMFASELHGQVDAGAHIVLGDDGRTVRVNLDALAGELRDQPLDGQARLDLVDMQPHNLEANLQLGRNRLVASQTGEQQWAINLDADALHQLWPGLSGRAQLEGDILADAGKLVLDGRISDAGWQDYHLEDAGLALTLHWLDNPDIDLALELHQVQLKPWDTVEKATLTLAGSCEDHRLGMDSTSHLAVFSLRADGRLPGCLEQPSAWNGQLTELTLADTLAGDWQLQDAAPVDISGADIKAGPVCLTTPADPSARLCLDELAVDGPGRAVVHIEQAPMDLFLLPLDPLYSLTTPLSGRVEAGWDDLGLSRIDGYLAWDEGELRVPEDDNTLLTINSARVEFEPGDDSALGVNIAVRVEDQTEINGRIDLADLRQPADTRLDGQARINLPDIAAFAHLVPQLDRIAGQMNGDIEITGPVMEPELSGRLALSNGHVVHSPMGLDVTDIGLSLSADRNSTRLTGQATSGDGRLQLSGSGQLLEQGWELDAQIDGEQFAFANTGWLRLNASPAIRLSARPDRLDIDGDIHIDHLRGGLPPGASDRIDPSPDIEVIGENDDDDGNNRRRRLHGRLNIDLGNNAELAAVGLKTQLAGDLELRWNGSPKPEGRGTLLLPEGSYHAYGQLLEIDDGEIAFTGRAIDDPILRIDAVREIFGDASVQKAGVRIGGSARHPDIQLFTDPPTTQEKALAYVITGSDFDHASGQGALNVGFYLLPKLLVSYGVGLFESGNVLSGRYEFSPRWGLRAVSGERDTGVDISYIINN